jgi:hypothetical protein
MGECDGVGAVHREVAVSRGVYSTKGRSARAASFPTLPLSGYGRVARHSGQSPRCQEWPHIRYGGSFQKGAPPHRFGLNISKGKSSQGRETKRPPIRCKLQVISSPPGRGRLRIRWRMKLQEGGRGVAGTSGDFAGVRSFGDAKQQADLQIAPE